MQIDFNEENFVKIYGMLTLLKEELDALNSGISKINVNPLLNQKVNSNLDSYLNDSVGNISISELQLRIENIAQILAKTGSNVQTLFQMLKAVENGKIEIVTNEYVLSDGTKYQITTIGEVNEMTPVVMFNHGWGQRNYLNDYDDGDYTYFYDWLENGAKGVLNAVIITYNRYANRTSDGKQNVGVAQQILEDAKKKYSFSESNYKFVGFSDGGEPALKQAADACRVDASLQSPEIMLLDGNVNPARGAIFSEEDLKILGERNAIVYVVERSNVRPDISHHKNWASYGINVISVRDQFAQISGTTGNTHMNVVADFTELGLINFLVAQGTITTDTFKGNYDYFLPTTIFDENTGQEVSFDIRGKSSNEVKSMLGLPFESNESFDISVENNYLLGSYNDVEENSINNIQAEIQSEEINQNNILGYNVLESDNKIGIVVSTDNSMSKEEVSSVISLPNSNNSKNDGVISEGGTSEVYTSISKDISTPDVTLENIVSQSNKISSSYVISGSHDTQIEKESVSVVSVGSKMSQSKEVQSFKSSLTQDTSLNDDLSTNLAESNTSKDENLSVISQNMGISKKEESVLPSIPETKVDVDNSIKDYLIPGVLVASVGAGIAALGVKNYNQTKKEKNKTE